MAGTESDGVQPTGFEPELDLASGTNEAVRQRPLGTLLASARRILKADIAKAGKARRKKPAERDWQDVAREMYRTVGEYQFVVNTVASKVGSGRLFVGRISKDDPSNEPDPVTDNPDVVAVLNSLGGTYAGRRQLLTRLAVNLMVVADGWIVGIPNHLLDPDTYPAPASGTAIALESLEWRFMSIKEVEIGNSQVRLKVDNLSDPIECSPDQVWMIRVWDPDPFEWWEATSTTRSNLPVLKELVGLTMHVSAQVDSRLAGAGIFLVPQSAQQALQQQYQDAQSDAATTDVFTEALVEAMLTPIGDRGAASAVVPLVVTVPDESIEKFKHITFSAPLDAEARGLREEAIRRLALGLDAPPEVLLGTSGQSHWGCVDPDTEILTRSGWVRYEQLHEGDSVLTLNHATGGAEWHPVEQVHLYDVVDAPMLRLAADGHDSWTTLTHRWPVVNADGGREWVTSETLEPGMAVTVAASGGAATVPTHSDALPVLAAAFAASGFASQRRGAACRLVRPVEGVRDALVAEFGEGTFYESADGMLELKSGPSRALLAAAFDGPAFQRMVSTEFLASLTQHQLELFLHTWAAYGHQAHGVTPGVVDGWLGNRARLDAFATAGTLAGYAVEWTQPEPRPGGSPGDWRVRLSSKQTVDPLAGSHEVGLYTGQIWCPQVHNRTWLARRGDAVFFTGNSWMVSADTIQSHVEPRLALICDALTTQYLWPVLEDQGIEGFKDYVVWYDVAHLITRPNRSQDAMALHDKKVISDEALRRETGFDEDDKPEDVDPVSEMILAMAQSNPGMLRSPALPQMVKALEAILAKDWDALSEEVAPPKQEAGVQPQSDATAAPAEPGGPAAGPPQPTAAEPVAPSQVPGAQEAAVEGEGTGAPRISTKTSLPIQGVQRAPVG